MLRNLAKKGFLFAALPGSKTNGTDFVGDALMHGANYILVPSDYKIPNEYTETVHVIHSENTRKDFAKIASKFYKSQPKNIIAVTGTSGKTSTVSFVQQLWHLCGSDKADLYDYLLMSQKNKDTLSRVEAASTRDIIWLLRKDYTQPQRA